MVCIVVASLAALRTADAARAAVPVDRRWYCEQLVRQVPRMGAVTIQHVGDTDQRTRVLRPRARVFDDERGAGVRREHQVAQRHGPVER